MSCWRLTSASFAERSEGVAAMEEGTRPSAVNRCSPGGRDYGREGGGRAVGSWGSERNRGSQSWPVMGEGGQVEQQGANPRDARPNFDVENSNLM